MSSALSNGGSVGEHWRHTQFVENLLAASHARDLAEAASEWQLERVDVYDKLTECNLCGTHMKRHVVLANTSNDARLIIGEDCYDKLVQYLDVGKVTSALPKREKHTHTLRDYWKGKLRELADETVLGWLLAELAEGRLPENIRLIVCTIKRLGFAPTTKDADTVVAFYKSARTFERKLLIPDNDLLWFSGRSRIPNLITIDQAILIRSLIMKDQELRQAAQAVLNHRDGMLAATKAVKPAREAVAAALARAKQACAQAVAEGSLLSTDAEAMIAEAEEKAKAAFSENCQYGSPAEVEAARRQIVQMLQDIGHKLTFLKRCWAICRSKVDEQFEWYYDLVNDATDDWVETADIAEDALNKAYSQVLELMPEKFAASESVMNQRRKAALKIGREWLSTYRWLLVEPEMIVSIKDPQRDKNIVMLKDPRNDQFSGTTTEVAERHRMPGVPAETGIYTARVIRDPDNTPKVAVLLLKHHPNDEHRAVVMLDFDKVSTPDQRRRFGRKGRHRFAGRFTAFYKDCEVVGAEVSRSGTYRCVVEKQGKKYRAWLI